MNLNKKIYSCLLTAMSVVMLLISTSCEDSDTAPSVIEDTYQFNIAFSTSTPTRAIELIDGNEDEDYLGGLTFTLYYNGSFLMSLSNKVVPLEEKNKYIAKIPTSDFESAYAAIGKTFSKSFLSEQNFQILVTSNWESYNSNLTTSITDDLTSLWTNSNIYNFTFKNGVSNSAWQPSVTDKSGIPMFGLSDKCKLIGSDQDYIIVPMMRALAKIEVFDVMKVPDSTYPFSIKSVTLSKSVGNGRLIPNAIENPNWNDVTKQVVTPSLPSSLTKVENIVLVPSTERITYNYVDKVYNKWVCYVPEMDLSNDDFKDAILDITLEGSENHAKVTLLNEIDKMNGNGYILRNGLYRFFVTGLRDMEVTLEAIIDPDPYGDINFINNGTNKWWTHKESVNDVEVEVWYKLVYSTDADRRSHWEKEWYFSEDETWFRWTGSSWEEQESNSQGPYDQYPEGVYSNDKFVEIITGLMDCDSYDVVESTAAQLFAQYGKTFEINGEPVKCFLLNQDMTLPTINGQNLLVMHRDYVWLGNGHTVKMKSYPNNGGYFNIGPVRDIYIEDPDGSNRLYIDKEGWISTSNENKVDQLTELTGDEKSYDLLVNGKIDKKSTYFSPKIIN